MTKLKCWKRTSPREFYNKEDNLRINIKHRNSGFFANIVNMNTHTQDSIVPYKSNQKEKETIKKVEKWIEKNDKC